MAIVSRTRRSRSAGPEAVHIGLVSPPTRVREQRPRIDHQHWRANLVILSAGLFVALTTAAMAVFPGGATFDLVARHYLFLGNYLSDLGATHTPSGRSNTASRVLFTSALVVVGASLGLFGPAWRAWATRGRGAVLGGVGTACAVLAGCFLVGAGFSPWDRDYDTHTALVRAGFGLVAAFIACLTAVQIRNHAPRRWIGANVISLVALAVYVWVIAYGPSIFVRNGLETQVAVQKAVVYLTVANLAAQGWAVRTLTGKPG